MDETQLLYEEIIFLDSELIENASELEELLELFLFLGFPTI